MAWLPRISHDLWGHGAQFLSGMIMMILQVPRIDPEAKTLQETAKNGRQNGVRFVSLHSIDHIFFDLLMSSITFSCLNPYFHVSIQHFPLFFVPPSWLFLELRSDQGWFGVGGRQAGLVLRPAAKAPGS